MEFYSILFENENMKPKALSFGMPSFFTDLNLDQIVQGILIGRETYQLEPYFYTQLTDVGAVRYRQEIMMDMENYTLYKGIEAFTHAMSRMREYHSFSKDLHNQYQQDRWHLEAAYVYCNAIRDLSAMLNEQSPRSSGLTNFGTWLQTYVNSDYFKKLDADTKAYRNELESIRYSIQVENDKIIIGEDDADADYCAEIGDIFKDIIDTDNSHEISVFQGLEFCALENSILNLVAGMHRKTFQLLDTFYNSYRHFCSPTLTEFDREIQFYLAYLSYIRRLREEGMLFTYPNFSADKEIRIIGGYDLALAKKLCGSGTEIVANDVVLKRDERIIVLTGPNQGGKTTFARMFGQTLFLASIGCPVPGSQATVFLCDMLQTLFPVEEDLTKNAGRLKEELTRLNVQLKGTTSSSVYIVNEFLTSTTSYDAYTLGKRLLNTLLELDCVCLYITHITELYSVSDKIISMVAVVDTEQNANRTFKIVRREADGRVYVNPIVEKYRLSYQDVKERINR